MCQTDFQCGDRAYCDQSIGVCITDCHSVDDCLHPIGCEERDDGCAPIGTRCHDGRCAGRIPRPGERLIGLDDDGWDAAPGAGVAFVVDAIAIGDADIGFNLDDRCAPSCVDNVLSTLGRHANTPIQQGITGSGTYLIVEVAGLVENYTNQDDAVTLKIYEATDADDDPTNNLDGSGMFFIRPESLHMAQARTRVHAGIKRHRLTTEDKFDLDLALTLGQGTRPTISFNDLRMTITMPSTLDGFEQGVLGGALRASTLHTIPNPYCRQAGALCSAIFPDSSLLDLVALSINRRPDIDVDRDGGECLLDTDGDQRIDLCCNGVGAADRCESCATVPVMSVTSDPADCALHPNMADGYSVGFATAGVRATLLGLR